MEVRLVEPGEYEVLGALTVDAYTRLEGHVPDERYEEELGDIAARVTAATVFVAVDDGGRVLGGVTYVGDHDSPFAEHGVVGAASIRMLAVDPPAQGRGVGEALVRACLERAAAEGRAEIVLHSTAWMTGAHRLYGRLGFVRDESLDWRVDALLLMGFRRRVAAGR